MDDPTAHMPGNEGETSYQIALAGKRDGIRQFPSKLCDQIRMSKQDKQMFRYGSWQFIITFEAVTSSNL